jgi:glycosyltransferase involved in cell wall biosynthesis
VSVVVPTRGRSGLLERTLTPLLEDPAALEVLVVVDGADADTLAWGESAAALPHRDRLRLVPIERSGEMGARQAGLDHARAELVLFVDDDVVAGPGLVSKHAAVHAGTEGLVVVGYHPAVIGLSPPAWKFATVLYAGEYERCCAGYERDPRTILLRLWAGNFSLRSDDARRVGLRNESFTEPYHPDRDFGLRCQQAGLTGVFDRRLWALHVHHRSLDAFLDDARNQGAGRRLVHRLHPHIVGPLHGNAFEDRLGPLARQIVRASRRERAQRILRPGARLALRAVQGSGSLGATLAFARISRRLEQQAAAGEFLRR